MSTADDKDGERRVQSIVDRVAQVQSLIKTILLIHKKDDRKRILSLKIVKRAMFSPFSLMPKDDFQKNTPGRSTATRELLAQ
eukprot:9269313-Ditylum_brightwellii.AAC.1